MLKVIGLILSFIGLILVLLGIFIFNQPVLIFGGCSIVPISMGMIFYKQKKI